MAEYHDPEPGCSVNHFLSKKKRKSKLRKLECVSRILQGHHRSEKVQMIFCDNVDSDIQVWKGGAEYTIILYQQGDKHLITTA